ncbi:MAG: DUF6326 family protein [Tenericutes bacterium]|jgi:hypothetical protein|nr:DUF6326 family protein [Mycoplasmatota bacterium]
MKQSLKDTKIDVKFKISALWMAMMMLYIYNDYFHLFPPESLQNIMDGQMGPLAVTQFGLLSAALLMAIPVIISVITLTLSAKIVKITNIIFGILYIFINIGNLIGEEWAFYIFLGIIQIFFTVIIVYLSFKWPKTETQQ